MLGLSHKSILLIALSAACGFAQAETISDAELAARYTVNGARVAGDNRIAIINDQIARVGEQIDAAEIIAIESGLIHLRVADRTFAMRVGSSLIRESQYSDTAIAAPPPERFANRIPDEPVERSVELVAVTATNYSHLPLRELVEVTQPQEAESLWIVEAGDTLSEIAATLTHDHQTHRSVMHSIYADNPHAFGDSIDLLYAGAQLSLAGSQQMSVAATRAAAARPLQREDGHDPPRAASVRPGDTLSGIAIRYVDDSITLNQLMLAIFEANPGSFGGNVNLLYANEILEIPDFSVALRYTPAAAAATMSRHAELWQAATDPAEIKHNTEQPPLIAMRASATPR